MVFVGPLILFGAEQIVEGGTKVLVTIVGFSRKASGQTFGASNNYLVISKMGG
jgi:hypothetical protein